MTGALRQIIAFGGGGFSMEAGNPLLDDYVLAAANKAHPKVCFLASASGDADHYIVRFYRAFDASRCEPSHLSLFRREAGAPDLRTHLLDQDVIYVGGGSVISLLGVWRAHGLDAILREAWTNGVLMCGVSAGSLCWFREAVTAFHGEPQRVTGLDLLPWSNTVHYDGEQARDRSYRQFLVDGLCPGYAAEDGAALHFVGERLVRAVSSRPHARAYRMRCVRGRVVKSAIKTRYLADGVLPALPAGGGGRGLSVAPDSGPAEVLPTAIAAGARS
ncbi:MAG TPA: peptidase E [Solirubrobacteraceae bacterium]|nr:peptidase E [Solirubrobacteraceae bacterium]